MLTSLTNENFAKFTAWLTAKRPLGFAMTDRQISLADTTGDSWLWTDTNDGLTTRALDAVRASGRKAWSLDAVDAAIRLTKRLRGDIDDHTWLHCATTAHAVVRPLEHGKEFPSRGASRDAVSTAKLMTRLTAESESSARRAVMLSAEQEQIWRRRSMIGRRVDRTLIAVEIPARLAKIKVHNAQAGIDLNPTTVRDKATLHTWLGEVGIKILDRDGKPTLRRDRYDGAEVPKTPEAIVRWKEFKDARSIVSRLDKYRELNRASDSEGRIYSKVIVRGARTGRQSVVKPALQNIARECRPVIICDPGKALVALDFDQIEPRVAAALSGDTQMIEDLTDGDIYERMASVIWPAQDAHANRGRAKTLLLAIMYSKGRPALAEELNSTDSVAQALLDQVWLRYPDLRLFTDKLKAQAKLGIPYVTTTGRLAPTPKGKEYAALNTAIQSEAADIMATATARVAAIVGTEALFLGVHDELIVEVGTNETEWARVVLVEQMSTTFFGLEITGKAEVMGSAWKAKPAR